SCGEMVDAEQLGEVVRIGDAALHLVQQRELPMEQRLATPRDVEEHLVEAVAKLGLVYRGRDCSALYAGERVAELAELVRAVREPSRLLGHVDRLATPQPADHGWKAVPGQVQRIRAQPLHPANDAARDPNGNQNEH